MAAAAFVVVVVAGAVVFLRRRRWGERRFLRSERLRIELRSTSESIHRICPFSGRWGEEETKERKWRSNKKGS